MWILISSAQIYLDVWSFWDKRKLLIVIRTRLGFWEALNPGRKSTKYIYFGLRFQYLTITTMEIPKKICYDFCILKGTTLGGKNLYENT